MKIPSDLALQKAAQAWGLCTTEKIPMDTDLCTAFAIILDDVWSKPWLGNATTRELLDELRARIEFDRRLNYRTVDEVG